MKRRFEFKLARLLRVRSIQEEEARGEWAGAEASANAAERAESALAEHLRADREALSTGLASASTGFSPATLLAQHAALDAQVRALATAGSRAQGLRRAADERARVWRERERERRALEELSQRERRRHLQALERAEEAERDELVRARLRRESQADSSATAPKSDGTGGAGKPFRSPAGDPHRRP